MSQIDAFELGSALADYELIDAIVNRPKQQTTKKSTPINNKQASVVFQEDNSEDYYKVIITVTIPRR